jgi:hypothetical protein
MRKLLPLLALGALAACGGDLTSSGDPLTQTEAGELAEALIDVGFVGFGGTTAPQAAPGEAGAVPFTYTISESGSCEGGGTASISGTVSGDFSETDGTGNATFDYTVTPNGCQVTTESDLVFTISGDPNISVSGSMTITETQFDFDFTYDGQFAWTSSDDRSGACVSVDISMSLDAVGEPTSVTATMNGEVCGHSVSRSLSVG